VTRIVETVELTVALDYSTFHLHTGDVDYDAIVNLGAEAWGTGIAQVGTTTVVVSPHQNNFAMPLLIEVWDGPPPEDFDDWEEAFEVHLEVGPDGLVYESPTLDFVELPVPQGSYRAVITGRGFVGDGWPGSTEPGDSWRIRLWPSKGPAEPRRLRAYRNDDEEREPAPAQYLEAGRAAAAPINDDLLGGPAARPLNDQTGTATASWTDPGTRRSLFRLIALPTWWGSGMSSEGNLEPGSGYRTSHNELDRDHFDGMPTGWWAERDVDYFSFELRGTFTVVESPKLITTEVQWFKLTGMGHQRRERPILPEPTIVIAELIQSRDEAGDPRTTVRIVHDGLPAAWVDDMAAVWNCKLEAGERVYRLGR
jgi:hypothetical protein